MVAAVDDEFFAGDEAAGGVTGEQQGGAAPAGWGGAAQQGGDGNQAAPPKATRSRAKATPAVDQAVSDTLMESTLIGARARVACAVLAAMDPDSSVEDIVDVSRELMQFVTEG